MFPPASYVFISEYELAILGLFFLAVTALSVLLKVVEYLRLYVFARLCPPDIKQYGKCAVVTGATDGIGKAYADQLARRGMDVILVSRNIDKLLSTSRELRDKYGVSVDFVQADFSKGWELYDYIWEKLKDREIGILINNVGTAEEGPCRFVHRKESSFVKMININIESALLMTSAVLPQMLRRRKGAVVTVSSLASEIALPFLDCYGGTKAASKQLSTALHYEYKSAGIVYQTLIPSFVNTKLLVLPLVRGRLGPLVPDASSYCRSAVVTLGSATVTTGYWAHELSWLFLATFPRWLWQLLYLLIHEFIVFPKRKDD